MYILIPCVPIHSSTDTIASLFTGISSGNINEDEVVLAEIKKSKFNIFDASIRCELVVPVNGIWDVTWSATLTIDGVTRDSPPSSQSRADLRSAAQRALVHRKGAMEAYAMRWTNEIHSFLRNQKLSSSTERQKVEANCSSLHPLISKGRDICKKLQHLLKSEGESSSHALSALLDALKEASDLQARLERMTENYGQRDARRAFKQTIAKKLELGDADTWVTSITNEELESLGGDANRLYQLLIEGKKANSLAFNDTTLEAAEARGDMFTPKQCETIKKRKLEVQAILAEELGNAVQEAQKREEEERKIKMMEEKARQMKFPRGTKVKIQGLKTRPELNDTMGTYLGLAHADRYTVRLDSDGSDIALKASNFTEWDFANDEILYPSEKKKVASWACKVCTFVHEGLQAIEDSCSMCGTPRGAEPPKSEDKSKHVQKDTGSSVKQQASQMPSKTKQKETQSAKPKTKPPPPPVAPTSAKAPVGKPPAKRETPSVPQVRAPSVKTQNNPFANAEPLNFQASLNSNLNSSSGLGLGRRCVLGLNCPQLEQGPDVCPFVHTPEEIAFYHPHDPLALGLSVLPTDLLSDNETFHTAMLDPNNLTAAEPVAAEPPTVSAPKLKNKTRCRYGIKCSNFKRGPEKCKFFHPPEDIAKVHPDLASTSVSSNPSSPTGSSQEVQRNILVQSNVTPHIVGKHKKHLHAMMKKSGAKIELNRAVDSNGMCTVRITGSPEAVEIAANLVVESSLKNAKFVESEESSILSNLTGDETPEASTLPAAASSESVSLESFLQKNKACLKCPPAKFLKFLLSEDIETLEALGEACEDEEYQTVLQDNGVKGFKRGPFIKAVKAALA